MGEKRTVGSAFVEKISAANLSKEQLFAHLYEITGKDCKLSELGLPSNPAIAFLESSKAKYRIKMYNQKAMATLPKIDKMKSIAKKKAVLEMLNIMAPKPKDYAVIAMDRYLKLNKEHTVDGFFNEYNAYKQKQQKQEHKSINYAAYKRAELEVS